MKRPKQVNRHCPFCNAHREHTVTPAKRRGRNQTRPLSRGSTSRMEKRGLRRGMGNLGKYSRPAIKSFKMTGKKLTTKTDLRFRCKKCNKTHGQATGMRAKKVELI